MTTGIAGTTGIAATGEAERREPSRYGSSPFGVSKSPLKFSNARVVGFRDDP
ncbi:unnamed protein product [Acidocella sp. C78]|nr:unnamed protein product [Acidocella sp. C78]